MASQPPEAEPSPEAPPVLRRAALDDSLPLAYDQLRRIAHGHLRRERPAHTLNTTALVHEAYLRLAGVGMIDWTDRSRFLGMASRAMRRVLVDYARSRSRLKRRPPDVVLDPPAALPVATLAEVLALDAALSDLEALQPRQCRVVECRFFAGMTHEETADALQVSVATVKRDWTVARAWLNAELSTACR